MTGTNIRINQLRNATSTRSVVVAFDHGFNGVVPGGENSYDVVNKLARSAIDGILIGPGLMRQLAPLLDYPGAPRMIVAIDGGTFGVLPGIEHPLSQHRQVISAEEALRHGAVAAKMLLPLGLGSTELLANSTALIAGAAEECNRIGLPLMVEPAFWGSEITTVSDEMIQHATRMSIELGATILKLPAPASMEVLEQIVQSTPIPVFVLGGVPTTGGTIGRSIVDWMKVGATGVAIGRNIWGRKDMTLAVDALRSAVHDLDADRAEELFAAADQGS